MTYKKYLIVASKKDPAGVNIITQLAQYKPNSLLAGMSDKPSFDIYLAEDEVIYTKNLDLDKINKYDFIIFATKHKSAKGTKSLSVHAPGNWRSADFGGEKGKICTTSAQFLKQIFEKLHLNYNEHKLKEYEVTLECTHHGPLIEKPCCFIEIGSNPDQWRDKKAGFIIAKTIKDIIQTFQPSTYVEIAVGIGGPHYCPNFNKIQAKSNFALSHIIPQYSLPLSEEMISEAIDKTREEIDFVILDWKGLGQLEQRQQIIEVLDNLHINYKKSSEVSK